MASISKGFVIRLSLGGVPQGKQVRTIRDGVDVIVATPGRLLDLVNQGHIDLSNIEVLVLDEADRMLDMGFINDIRRIVEMTRDDRQTLFFSATVSREIRKLSENILTKPVNIETAVESTTVDAIEQCIYMVDRMNKPEMLVRVLNDPMLSRSLVFSKTKHGCDKLVKMLRRENIEAESIHGDKSQNARTRAMRRFKSGSTKVLIATDIASRGIDVNNISHVINYDMPLDPETYVHRIGRTARAGAKGIAVSFCGFDEMNLFRQIERRSKIQIPVSEDHEDLTFDAPPPSRSVRKSRSGGGGFGGGGGRGGRSDRGGRGGQSGGGYQGNRKPRTGGRKAYGERTFADSNSSDSSNGHSRDGQRDGQREGQGEYSDSPRVARKPHTGGGVKFKKSNDSSGYQSNGYQSDRSERSDRSDRPQGESSQGESSGYSGAGHSHEHATEAEDQGQGWRQGSSGEWPEANEAEEGHWISEE